MRIGRYAVRWLGTWSVRLPRRAGPGCGAYPGLKVGPVEIRKVDYRRRPCWLRRLCEAWLSGNRLVRRFLGGHWERWWIGSPINAAVWLPRLVPGCRPGLGEKLLKVEDWP